MSLAIVVVILNLIGLTMLPNLIIIGAMKCGTTSLHHYLDLHPEVSMSKRKELNFFTEKKYRKGIEWYSSHFTKDSKVVGESSPNYTNSAKFTGVPKRMHALIPGAKLIYLVRDPIKRMIAHYTHQYSCSLEDKTIDEALTNPIDNLYLDRSLYCKQISLFLDYFDIDQIMILSAECLRYERGKALRNVFEFLEVDAKFTTNKFNRQRHVTSYKRRKNNMGKAISKSFVSNGMKLLPKQYRHILETAIYWPFSEPVGEFKLSEKAHRTVQALLAKDVGQFRKITRQSFSHWGV